MSEIICPNCGSHVILPEHSSVCVGRTISKEGNDTYVLPMSSPVRDSKGRFCKKDININNNKATSNVNEEKENKTMTRTEMRLETLKKNGIDTSTYFSIKNNNGEDVLMKWENGIPVVVPENDADDPILEQIVSSGYVKNTKLHRRWVMSQMFHALNYNGYNYYKDSTGKYKSEPVSGYEAYVRSHGYSYQWSMLLEEIRVIGKLETKDKDSFNERVSFFDSEVIVGCCIHYLEQLKYYVDGLKIRHCKGVPYKRISGKDIFIDDLSSKLYTPIRKAIREMAAYESVNTYTGMYRLLKNFIRKFVDVYKLPNNTPFAPVWKDAFKGSGSYFTLKNLLMYHGCYITVSPTDKRTGSAGISYINSFLDKYKYQGYRYFAMMKKVIKDNNFDYNARMIELGVKNNR